jgi:PAS domain S-box-containing protein
MHDNDEASRIAEIEAHDLLSFSEAPGFDDITSFAAALCATPIALISLVEAKRQRFLSKVGLDVGETPRETSFCAHAMRQRELMIVSDATADPRFSSNPLVTGEPYIRFYAGAPLVTDEGVPLGSLCVIDRHPRAGLSPVQDQGLRLMADQVMVALRARKKARMHLNVDQETQQTLRESEQKFRILADTMPQMVWSTLPDGYHDYYNARWYEYTGVPEGSTDGEGWNGMFHPDDQERAWSTWTHSLETGEPYGIEYRLRNAAGEYRWTLGRALPIRDEAGRITRWFGTCTDIHEHKLLLEQREIVSQELSHRIKNIFAVIGGLMSLSSKAHPEIASHAGELRARIMALGKAHDFVRPHSARSRPAKEQTSLQGMLSALLAAYQSSSDARISIAGMDAEIDDRSATPLALIFHELATNAVKYGALSSAEGRIEIDIGTARGADRGTAADDVRIAWTENGGPEIQSPPNTEGFGSRLIELSITNQLRGNLVYAWDRNGLRVVVKIPKSSMSRSGA